MATFAQEAFAGTVLEALNPIRDISKNWGIDLAQHLEQYLGQIAIEHGTNFAEAAMLIENSAVIYVKKVDYVWNISQALLETLRKGKLNSDKKKKASEEESAEGVTDDSAPKTPKTKKDKHLNLNKSKYGEIDIEVSEKLLELEPSKEKRKSFKSLHDVSHQFLKRPLSRKRAYVYAGNGGDDAQEERRYKSNALLLANLILHHEFQEDGHGAGTTRPSFFTACHNGEPSFFADDVPMDQCDDNETNVESQLPDKSNVDGVDPETRPDAEPEKRTDERAKGKKATENIYEGPHPDSLANPWDPIPMATDVPSKPISKKKKTKLPCDPRLLELDACAAFKRKNGKDGPELPSRHPQKIMLRYLVDHLMANNNFNVNPEFYELMRVQRDRLKKRKRRKQRDFEEIRPTLQQDYDKFADFHGFEDYEPSASETNGENDVFLIPLYPEYPSLFRNEAFSAATSRYTGFLGFNEDEEEDELDDLCPDAEPAADTSFPSPSRARSPSPPPFEAAMRDSPITGNVDAEREALVMDAAPKETAEQNLQSQMALAKRVAQWHESIKPMLAAAERRGHFDIHEYGTRIIDSFPRDGGRHTLSMQRLVRDVENRDVARYFLATLQLANTYNVEISTPKEDLTMDRIELTLLSVQRHHEELEDYVAPSKEGSSGNDNIVSSSVHRVHSSPSKPTKTKKRKL